MNTPYRPREARDYEGLLEVERAALRGVGTLLRAAGVVGLLAAGAGIWAWTRGDRTGLLMTVVPTILTVPLLYAGAVLSRLPGGSRDYRSIARAIAGLRVAYAIKALAVLLLVLFFPALVALFVVFAIVAVLAELLVFLLSGPGSLLVFAVGLWLLRHRWMRKAP